MPPRLRLTGAALGAGLLLTLALPPFGWWPLAVAGVAVLDRLLAGRRLRGRVAVGLATGIGFVAPGWWWMTEFHVAGWAAAAVLEAGLFAVGATLVPPGRGRRLALPGALVLAEALRTVWPFGGVPIATLAQTQAASPLAPVVRLGGSLLLAGAVGAAGVALSALAARRWRPAAVAGGAAAAVVAAGWAVPLPRPVGTMAAAVVQGGGQRGTRAIHTSEADVFRRHLQATEAVRPPVDLVLWPEDVVDVEGPVLATPAADRLAALARDLDATLVVGVVEGLGDRFRNAAVAWGPDGRPVARYDKVYRVPFGEWVPFRSVLEGVVDLSIIPRDAIAGEGAGLLRTPAGELGVIISFEVFFGVRANAAVAAGGDVLLLPTNASSYSTTQMPALVLAATRLRALETGRVVLQAAPTGFSAVVGPDGSVRRRTDLGGPGVLQATVERRAGLTPYTRAGDTPTVAAAGAAVVAGWALTRRPRSPVPRTAATGPAAVAPRAAGSRVRR